MGFDNPVHLLILGAIILIVLGPKRLPEVGRSLGRGLREFKAGIGGGGDDDEHHALELHSDEASKRPVEPAATTTVAADDATSADPAAPTPASSGTGPASPGS